MKQKPDYVILLASNFIDEISRILKDKFSFIGGSIVPLLNSHKIRMGG